MYIDIDSHDGSPVDWTIFGQKVHIEVKASLQQDSETGEFRLLFQSSSTRNGVSAVSYDTERPISGNVPPTVIPSQHEPALSTTYAVSDWTLTDHRVSCTLQLSLELRKFGEHQGTLFDGNPETSQFAGALPFARQAA